VEEVQLFSPALQKEPYGEGGVLNLGLCSGGFVMLWSAFVMLLVLWLLGFSFQVAGVFIHLLLVAAFVLLIVSILNNRRTVT
jgi:hypothetical protein